MELAERVQWRTVAGRPVRAHGLIVTPEARALTIRLGVGGLVWNRPVAVLVEKDGVARRIPVVDVTRLIELALAVLAFGLVLASRASAPSGKERRNERGG